jgi:putative hemolysin
MPEGNPILELLLVLVLILIGGFFAASEIALITVKRHRLNQLVGEGSRAARVAQRLTEDPSRFLATIQIALTFLGFMASAVGAVALSGSLTNIIQVIPLEPIQNAARGISFVLVTMLIALASIIVGELVPKTLALSFADRFAIFVARPIGWFDRILRPVVWFVQTVSNVLVRALGGRDRPQAGYLSTEELKMLVETGSEQGGIEEDEK